MPVALILRLSDQTAGPVEALARRVGPALPHPPHVTLAVLAGATADAVVVAAAARLAAGRGALAIDLASIGLFTAPDTVLFLAPVVTRQLLDWHAAALAALPAASIHPQHRAGAWVPHVTLAAGLIDAPGGLAAVGTPPLPLRAWLDRLEVVRFPPAVVLASHPLPGPLPSPLPRPLPG